MKLFYLKLKDKFGNYLFFCIVLLLYLIIAIFDFNYFIICITYFIKTFIKQILPLLFIVYFFIFIFNLLIKNKNIYNKISNSKNTTKYFFVIIFGILSTGPVYMWYPILQKLHKNGLRHEHIATFIYSRAIKIPFLTIMIFYFGIKYTLVFNLTILFLSILSGITINLLFNFINYENNNS